MRRYLPCVALLWAGCSVATAATPPQTKEMPAPADISEVKDKLTVWTDGKKHFLALVMSTNSDLPVFWSTDGKDFYQLRIGGGGSEGGDAALKRLDRIFWDPRANAPYQAGFDYKAESKTGKMTVQCIERKTPFDQVPAPEAKAMIDAAKFYKARWNRYAYALARDNTGRYFYVDNQREPENSKVFRLYAGPKGNMKLQKMTNVVSDSEGDIFSTKTGSLRLILNKQETQWVASAKKTKLVYLPIDDNHVMIYTDLGVYTGMPLGTPCDDL
jgi:hypothetical protein